MNQSTVEYYYKNILLAISSFVSTKKDLELTYKYKKHHISSLFFYFYFILFKYCK